MENWQLCQLFIQYQKRAPLGVNRPYMLHCVQPRQPRPHQEQADRVRQTCHFNQTFVFLLRVQNLSKKKKTANVCVDVANSNSNLNQNMNCMLDKGVVTVKIH